MAETDSVVTPGPCPEEGCPAPTEIDCIEVTKVYDFCFQTDVRDQVFFTIPASCGTIPAGSTASGTVTSVTCSAQSIVPIPNSGGFANVTLMITVTESITITAPDGATICTFTGSFFYFKTVTLCAPTGVTISCESPATSVGPLVIMAGEVIGPQSICLLIQSTAVVKLLIPTYGFCLPAPCVVLPNPPFTCPPSPLFPPQCTTPFPTASPTTSMV